MFDRVVKGSMNFPPSYHGNELTPDQEALHKAFRSGLIRTAAITRRTARGAIFVRTVSPTR